MAAFGERLESDQVQLIDGRSCPDHELGLYLCPGIDFVAEESARCRDHAEHSLNKLVFTIPISSEPEEYC